MQSENTFKWVKAGSAFAKFISSKCATTPPEALATREAAAPVPNGTPPL